MNNKIQIQVIRYVVASLIISIAFLCFFSGISQATESVKEDQVPSSSLTSHITADEAFLGMKNLPRDLQILVSSHLPYDEKCQWRLISKWHRDLIDLTFFGPVYDPYYIATFSSETSGGTIGGHIFDLVKTAQYRIIIASDKCTNEEFLDDLLTLNIGREKPLEIRIATGQDKDTDELLIKEKYGGIVWQSIPSHSGKMHNKFIIVDDCLVITGSPNLTYAAYNYNIESFVALHHRFIAQLYSRYYEYIVSGKDKYDSTQDEYCRVAKMMDVFNNAPGNLIKICLAPILNIKTFVIDELESSQVIDINMFLICRATIQDNDIVDNLLKIAREGAGITIKIDEGQYKKHAYVRRALGPLVELDQEIYKVSKKREKWSTRTQKIRTLPQFHDKLVLIQHQNGGKKVFIGSAGFTEHVQDNVNLENMVLLYMPVIYDQLLIHFNSINGSRLNVTKL